MFTDGKTVSLTRPRLGHPQLILKQRLQSLFGTSQLPALLIPALRGPTGIEDPADLPYTGLILCAHDPGLVGSATLVCPPQNRDPNTGQPLLSERVPALTDVYS